MIEINYERVYKATALFDAVRAANNRKIEAESALAQAEKAFQEGVAKICGVSIERLDFSNVACMARGIPHHVYYMTKAQGFGNVCVFCGCDDRSGDY